MGRKAKDLTGFIVGTLTVLNKEYISKNKHGKACHYWKASCDCGNIVVKKTSDYTRKRVGVGCDKCKSITHGLRKHPLYSTWLNMKDRCYNPKNVKYEYYSKRGVCSLWADSSEAFINWSLDNGYKKGLTLDRIDNSLGYSPHNCRYTTRKIQAINRDYTLYGKGVLDEVLEFFNGKEKEEINFSELARKYNVAPSTIRKLFNKETY